MSGFACLPVTALDVVQVQDVTLLLSGAGSFLTIYDARDAHSLYYRTRVFSCQNVHGITSTRQQSHGTGDPVQIVVWGGRLVRIGVLSIQTSNLKVTPTTIDLSLYTTIDVGDWILDVSVDAAKREAVLLTAHNKLHKFLIGDESLQLICSGPQTLLYSGHVLFARDNHFIIASGTVFGEIVVWTFSKQKDLSWATQMRHTFLGHQGSVFGVRLTSEIMWEGVPRRLLASCSDDRTIRIWDVSNCDHSTAEIDVTESNTRETGFGAQHEADSHLTMAWGHLSRIWNICFQPSSGPDTVDHIGLLSRGEDGVCQLWKLDLKKLFVQDRSGSESLTRVSHDRHHAGKNVWSFVSTVINGASKTFTGGADGQVVMRHPSLNAHHSFEDEKKIHFKQISKCLSEDSESKHTSSGPNLSLRQYLLLEHDNVIATTVSGDILLGNTHTICQWSLIFSSKDHKPVAMSTNLGGKFAFFASADGSMFAYDTINRNIIHYTCSLPSSTAWMQVVHTSEEFENGSTVFRLLLNMREGLPRLLTIKHACTGTSIEQCVIHLPSGFVTTSGLYDVERKLLICGSRTSALAVFTGVSEASREAITPYVRRHIHDSDAITAIVGVPRDNETDAAETSYFLSTGRNGTVACYKIMLTAGDVIIRTLHRSSPPLGPNIEGAYFSQSVSGKSVLIIYGFKSTEFTVWDETNQTSLMSVECGGAHRSWNYSSCMVSGGLSNTFVWTKAGTFHACHKGPSNHRTIQYGGHGREIKALAISPLLTSLEAGHNSRKRLIATGAEDTDIRLFTYTAGAWDRKSDLSLISVLRGHTTGLQHLMFSPCGQFLFSSGGAEEFYIWRLESVPCLGMGVVLVAKLEKNLEDLDARIMSFDICSRADHSDKFTILLAYSNGKARVLSFSYEDSDDGREVYPKNEPLIKVLHEYSVGLICLTQAYILVSENRNFSMTGATDGTLRLLGHDDSISEMMMHQVHQSNVAAMAVHEVTPDTRLVVTGGDDNALAITTLNIGSVTKKPCMLTMLVPDAHAAALTAVAILRSHTSDCEHTALIVTAGNDQKVKLWRVKISSPTGNNEPHTDMKQRMGLLDLEMLGEYWTDVADISSVEILDDYSDHDTDAATQPVLTAVIAGVGIQMLHLGHCR